MGLAALHPENLGFLSCLAMQGVLIVKCFHMLTFMISHGESFNHCVDSLLGARTSFLEC